MLRGIRRLCFANPLRGTPGTLNAVSDSFMPNLYDYPRYYELAFSFRGLDEEVDVCEQAIEKFSRVPVRRVLELACGPAAHMAEFAKRGYQYVGIDNSAAMLDYAGRKATSQSIEAEFVEADMKSFILSDLVDFAFVTLDSFYLSTSEDVVSHLESVAGALRSGGLYVLQWCVHFDWDVDKVEKAQWTTEVDGVKVDFLSHYDRVLNRTEQIRELRLEAEVDDNGEKVHLESVVPIRIVFPQEFLLLLERSGVFEFVGWWNKLDLTQPIPACEPVDWPLTVIRRL